MTHPPTPANISIRDVDAQTLQALTRLTRTLLPINYPDKFFTSLLQPVGAANAFSLAKVALWTEHGPVAPDTIICKTDDGASFSSASVSGSTSIATAHPPHEAQEEERQVVVGGICGRILQVESDGTTATSSSSSSSSSSPPSNLASGECDLYIATLAVLAPWRGQGIAAALLRELVRTAVECTRSCEDSGSEIVGHLPVAGAGEGAASLGRLTGVYAHVWETNEAGLDWYRAQGFEVGDLVRGYYRKLRPDGARVVRRGVVELLL